MLTIYIACKIDHGAIPIRCNTHTEMVAPYIMQHQLPDIENAIHQEHAGKIDNIEKKILKLEKHVAEIEEIVDTTCSGKCARCVGSFLSLGFTILMIYVAVKVLS